MQKQISEKRKHKDELIIELEEVQKSLEKNLKPFINVSKISIIYNSKVKLYIDSFNYYFYTEAKK
jgi:hypothetical protein